VKRKRVGANTRQKIVRKKSKDKQRIGKTLRIVSLLSVVVVVGVFAFMGIKKLVGIGSFKDVAKITRVKVSGGTIVDRAQMYKLLAVDSLLLQPETIRSRLKQRAQSIDWVEKVSVRRSGLHSLRVKVFERNPIALVALETVQFVDKNGVVFNLQDGKYLRLPLVTGLKDSSAADGQVLTQQSLQSLLSVQSELVATAPLLYRDVSQIHFAPDSTVRLVLAGHQMYIVMNQSTIAQRTKHLQSLLSDYAVSTARKIKSINLQYKGVAYVN